MPRTFDPFQKLNALEFFFFFNQRLRQHHGCQLLIPKETDHCR